MANFENSIFVKTMMQIFGKKIPSLNKSILSTKKKDIKFFFNDNI